MQSEDGRHLKGGQGVIPETDHWTMEPKLLSTHPQSSRLMGGGGQVRNRRLSSLERTIMSFSDQKMTIWLFTCEMRSHTQLLRQRMLIAWTLMHLSHHFCIYSSVDAVSLVWLLSPGFPGPLTGGTGTDLDFKAAENPSWAARLLAKPVSASSKPLVPGLLCVTACLWKP